MATNIWFWVLFNLFVISMLALDLGIFNKKSHKVGTKEAILWSIMWISLALIFNLGLWFFEGQEIALQFLGGYLLEKSLSVDNIFVFVMIFTYFGVQSQYQHRVLYWGILSALVLRGAMILAGAALISQFEILITIFGILLIVTALRMANDNDELIDLENNAVVRLGRRFLKLTDGYRGNKFIVIENGVRLFTPLILVLFVIETSDVVFAIDSIPAVFGITRDPFIVYTSNIFAILGLRSLYFLLASVVDKFHYLKTGLAIVLAFVGIKMVVESLSGFAWVQELLANTAGIHLEHGLHMPIEWSLAVIAVVLGGSIALSLIFPKAPKAEKSSDELPESIRSAQDELASIQSDTGD